VFGFCPGMEQRIIGAKTTGHNSSKLTTLPTSPPSPTLAAATTRLYQTAAAAATGQLYPTTTATVTAFWPAAKG
jgi:hypothetical protein